jgi:sulfate adenylyltransferase subunit 1
VDARHGVVEQTRRHTFIASLLRIPHVIVCVNKMDLVDWSEDRFNSIVHDFREAAEKIGLEADAHFLPISALAGDNVVDGSENMPWYGGRTLLQLLETLPIENDLNRQEARFAVQYVIRPMLEEYHDYRGYAGRVAGGVLRPGDSVKVLPGGQATKIIGIDTADGPLDAAFAPMSVTLRLEDEIDISRGDIIVAGDCGPECDAELEAMVCWMGPKPLQVGARYAVRHTTRDARCIVREIAHKIDMTTLEEVPTDEVALNDIARVTLKTTVSLCADSYKRNRDTGSLILIDEATNVTVGAAMIC